MIGLLDCLVLGDRVLCLGQRQSAQLSESRGYYECEDIFLEEALADELL